VVLPEMWNCPYSNDSFPTYAEDVEGGEGQSPSTSMLAAAAADNRVVLVCPSSGCAVCFWSWGCQPTIVARFAGAGAGGAAGVAMVAVWLHALALPGPACSPHRSILCTRRWAAAYRSELAGDSTTHALCTVGMASC
jgi:hypothetical protein